MEKEMIAVCEEDGTAIGVATREDIHRKGLWHETFHCWIVEIKDGTPYIHLQLRSPVKKDFPDLLDISAAGHILAHETVQEGARELKEELGIDIGFEELIPLGIIKDQLSLQNFLDNERCHVFLYKTELNLDGLYKFQEDEVAGMFKFDFREFHNLCSGIEDRIDSKGKVAGDGVPSRKSISLADLVPHGDEYLERVMRAIQDALT